MSTCKSCNTALNGKYCNLCGEKVVEDRDFTLKFIIEQAVANITNLDSKFFQTIRLLFFHPGKLSRNYVEGRRVRFMKPFQLFVLANLVFFFFLNDTDFFRTPAKWFFIENFDGIPVLEIAQQIADNNGMDLAQIKATYDRRSSNLAKGLIFLLIPLIAIICGSLNFKKRMAFGKHVVFSVHYFSFVLISCVVLAQLLRVIPFNLSKWYFILPVTSLITIYCIGAFKNFYKNPWGHALLKGIVATFLIGACIQFYRMFINMISLHTIG